MEKLEKLKQLEILLNYEIMKTKRKRDRLKDYPPDTFRRIPEVIDKLDVFEIFEYIKKYRLYWVVDEYLRYKDSIQEMRFKLEEDSNTIR